MNLKEYKTALKGFEANIAAIANAEFDRDWRIGAKGALNTALRRLGVNAPLCANDNTANAVLEYCERKK